MSQRFDRREFIRTGTTTAIGGSLLYAAIENFNSKQNFFNKLRSLRIKKPYSFPVELSGPNFKIAHQMRNAIPELNKIKMSLQKQAETNEVLILGGGIAGLSAGWWLQRQGVKEFQILELESQVGGNSRSEKSIISMFPLGAHYLPLPNSEATELKLLLEEMGLITGYDQQQRPLFAAEHLVADPEERLLKDGLWHEGLVPKIGLTANEMQEIDRFFALMNDFKIAIGQDGKPAFAIPVARSSSDEKFLQLDRISFADFLQQRQFDAKPLLWFLNYSTRDDYGVGIESVSAWAGIHYFAGRRGHAGNASDHEVLTWPQGNGYFVQHFSHILHSHIQTNKFIAHIEKENQKYFVYTYDINKNSWTCLQARQIIYAMPQMTAKYLLPDFVQSPIASHYAPWLVANIGLKKIPKGEGFQSAWDNVSYHSNSLGYIIATHQNLVLKPQETVITYYQPLDQIEPKKMREFMLSGTIDDFLPAIIKDLEKMHPDIQQDILFVKIWLWGHGMISPKTNYIWNENRKKIQLTNQNLHPHIHFAHTDQTGISIFEEAHYHGVRAAQKVLQHLKIDPS